MLKRCCWLQTIPIPGVVNLHLMAQCKCNSFFIKLLYFCNDLTRPGATVSFRLHPEHRRFQPSPSPVVVILAASDSTYTAVGDCTFPVAGCCFWNSLPPDITSASTLSVFRNRLKTYLFSNCFRFLVLHTVYSSGFTVFVL